MLRTIKLERQSLETLLRQGLGRELAQSVAVPATVTTAMDEVSLRYATKHGGHTYLYVMPHPTSTDEPAIHFVPEGAYGSTCEPRSPIVALSFAEFTVVKTASPPPPG